MKVALIQCNVRNGDLGSNSEKILAAARSAPEHTLCVVARDTLTGPKNYCLMREPDFDIRLAQALESLASQLPGNQMLLCGVRTRGTFLLHKGRVALIDKYFQWHNLKIAISPDKEAGDADLRINMEGRRFSIDSQAEWEMILSGYARQTGIGQIAVNLVGGYCSAIYNGQSFYVTPAGAIGGRARAFAEDCLLIDFEQENRIEPLCAGKEAATWSALTLGLRDFVHKAGAKKAVLGLSGGMDSALVACIAADALGAENVMAALMPSQFTSAESIRDARTLAKNLQIDLLAISIESIRKSFMSELEPAFAQLPAITPDLTSENLQARIRGVLLMAIANRTGALVLNTGNKSESAMGYSTLYGDSVGAVAVIGDLFKTEVYQLAQWYCRENNGAVIPGNIFTRPPSAELAPGQKDTDSLPPYDELDPMLASIMAGYPEALPEDALAQLRARVAASAFKRRQSPPVLCIGDLRPCAERDL